MSAALGERSGNRGRCAGCCRKQYTLLDLDNNKKIKTGYLLSMKDLNLSNYVTKMPFVDSFKIEGRMKEASYVAGIVKYYRSLLDNQKANNEHIYKNFQRTFTKGYIFGTDPKDITNTIKPNNFGYLIGTVISKKNNLVEIKLFSSLKQGTTILISFLSIKPLQSVSI
jgi:putative protease